MILYICRHPQSHMPLFMPRIERAGLCVHVARDSAVAQAVRSLVGCPGASLGDQWRSPTLGIPLDPRYWMILDGAVTGRWRCRMLAWIRSRGWGLQHFFGCKKDHNWWQFWKGKPWWPIGFGDFWVQYLTEPTDFCINYIVSILAKSTNHANAAFWISMILGSQQDMDPWWSMESTVNGFRCASWRHEPWWIRIRAVDPNSAGHFDQGLDVERLVDDGKPMDWLKGKS